MDESTQVQHNLRDYFAGREEVQLAFLFGSYAKNRFTRESDMDIAVYFQSKNNLLELEEDGEYTSEDQIWSDLVDITHHSVDLVIMNRAPATLVHTIFEEGIPLIVKNTSLYWRLYLASDRIAEDFREFINDFWEIKQRSSSLNKADRERLIKIIDFLEEEIKDYDHFKDFNKRKYLLDRDARRNLERFIENIVNASIDAAKLLLASEKKRVPQTYKETLSNLSLLEGFSSEDSKELSSNTRLRNILAHEYLDLRFEKINRFIQRSKPIYQRFIDYVKGFLSQHQSEE
jgi:uncharacterized protein YutE (UPF0331/DUF86 family)/predicted nucleotidyltransferase